MSDFRLQIQEDIKHYQEEMPNVGNGKILTDDWAFNFWILDKIYSVDEDVIEEQIVDLCDFGIDAYEIFEETKDVYLIQNKYYTDNSQISKEEVLNHILTTGIGALENGTYRKSEELQDFFTKYKNDPNFCVHIRFYITNNNKNSALEQEIMKYNRNHSNYEAEIFYLDDIEKAYYGEILQEKKDLTVTIQTIDRNTTLNINPKLGLNNVIDARYVLVPVTCLYNMYNVALKNNYPIFDKNIREFLGNTAINKRIIATLSDADDRKNFFYYNNGITIICDNIGDGHQYTMPKNNINRFFEIRNPQIVNGCQTVNTIYHVLKNVAPENLETTYKDTFVMLKILQINPNNDDQKRLANYIVRYNNSQNSIDEKTFVANNDMFIRMQKEFASRGLLLLIKQSDKNKFTMKYKRNITPLVNLNKRLMTKFGLNVKNSVSDFCVPLDKLLQVITAFFVGAHTSYAKKTNMLKIGSNEYNDVIKFIKKVSSIDTLINLYLLFKRAEQEKKTSKDGRTPIPFYLIDGFAKYECKERKHENILKVLSSQAEIDELVELYSNITKTYTKRFSKMYKIDYNKMIKTAIDYEILSDEHDTYSS